MVDSLLIFIIIMIRCPIAIRSTRMESARPSIGEQPILCPESIRHQRGNLAALLRLRRHLGRARRPSKSQVQTAHHPITRGLAIPTRCRLRHCRFCLGRLR